MPQLFRHLSAVALGRRLLLLPGSPSHWPAASASFASPSDSGVNQLLGPHGPVLQVQSDNTLGVVDPTGGADFSDIPVVLPSSTANVNHLLLQSAHLPDLRQHEKLVH